MLFIEVSPTRCVNLRYVQEVRFAANEKKALLIMHDGDSVPVQGEHEVSRLRNFLEHGYTVKL